MTEGAYLIDSTKTITRQLLEFIDQNGGASTLAVANHFGESREWAHGKIQDLRKSGYIKSPKVETVYIITDYGQANLERRALTTAEHYANRRKRQQRARDLARMKTQGESVLIAARSVPNSVFAMGGL